MKEHEGRCFVTTEGALGCTKEHRTGTHQGYVTIHSRSCETADKQRWEASFVVLRLDYVSCVLTVVSTILVGRKCWEGWILAGINSAIVCVIGYRTAQIGFIPANLVCIIMYGFNLRAWKRGEA
jgi:hypothetical protein